MILNSVLPDWIFQRLIFGHLQLQIALQVQRACHYETDESLAHWLAVQAWFYKWWTREDERKDYEELFQRALEQDKEEQGE